MRLNVIEAGAGTPVVLLHGLFGAARNFGVVQRRLSARARVIALDLRNHGSSPHGPIDGYATLAADVMETLAAIGALPCTLIGHSMGGKVAMRAALDHAPRIRRLIVSDIAPVQNTSRFVAMAAAMLALELTPGLTRAQAGEALAQAVPDRTMRAFLLQNLLTGDAPAWRIGLAEIAAALPAIEAWDSLPAGARYDGPTLFVTGVLSDYVLPEHRPIIRALFPAARFAAIKDAGHWVHADNPEGFVAVVEAAIGPGRGDAG